VDGNLLTESHIPGEISLKGRIRKGRILEILSGSNAAAGLLELGRDSPRKIVNGLFPLLYSQDEIVKWRAVTFMGLFVRNLAEEDMESARDVVRRLMWNLNDESGGIGWGSPEAMGEILTCHEGLAGEYAPILLSYANRDGNYLELPMLQRGLLWGIARFSEVRPHVVRGSKSHIFPYLESDDPAVRGHAARIVGLIGTMEDRDRLSPLAGDSSDYTTFFNHRCMRCNVGETAREALLNIEKKS